MTRFTTEGKEVLCGWQDISTAPRDGSEIQARIPGYGEDNIIAWQGDAFLDSDGETCGGWAFTTEQEPPDCWTDGICWSVNEDGDASAQPTHWKRAPASLISGEMIGDSIADYLVRFSVDNWLSANERIRAHPQAALLIASRYPVRQADHVRRTAVCAAGTNTPLWQQAVRDAYADQGLLNLADALVDDLMSLSDEELLAEAVEDGVDVEREARELRRISTPASPTTPDRAEAGK